MVPVLGITQQKLMRFSTCMDKSCCCNNSSFSLFLDDSNTTHFTGVGTQQNPIKSHVKVSADNGNIIEIRQDGIFAPGTFDFILTTVDSDSIDFSGAGTAQAPLTGVVKISASPTNILMLNDDGLYVPAPTPTSILTADTTSIDLEGTGLTGNPITATVKISADTGNTVEIRSDGVYAAGGGTTDVQIADSPSVNLSGNGEVGTPLTADVIISPDAGNILQENANGLFVTVPNTCINSVTYLELIDLMFGDGEEGSGGLLKPGCLYLINDYQSIGTIFRLAYDGGSISKTDTGTTFTGDIDPILIRAVDGFTLEPWGTTSNGDEVEYDVFAGEKGLITRRINKTLNINIPMDWYAVQYVYDNTAAGGTMADVTLKVFNGNNDQGTSNFTRQSNGIYIGRNAYGQNPDVIFAASSNAIHFNVGAFTGPYFICNSAQNVSKGSFSYLDATANLAGENDYV